MGRRNFAREYGDGQFFYSESRKRWIGRIEAGYTSTGGRRQIQVSHKDKGKAWDKFQALRRKVRLEGLPAEGMASSPKVAAWIEKWLANRVHDVRPKTFASERSVLRKHVIPALGMKQLDQLRPSDLRTLTRAMAAAGSNSTHQGYGQRIFVQTLKDAATEGYTIAPGIFHARKPAEAINTRTSLPLDDAIAMLQVAATRPDSSRWVAAFLQGMRQAECLGLTWDAVDLDAETVDVSWQLQELPYLDREAETFRIPDGFEAIHLTRSFHLTRPKTAAGQRILPLVPWMTAQLHQLKARGVESPHNLVWPRPSDPSMPQRPEFDRAAFYELQQQAGITKGAKQITDKLGDTIEKPTYYVVHEARHTTASLLEAVGVAPSVIQLILGHSDLASSERYKHADLAAARLAMNTLAGQLGIGA
ncbi:site-specific integrase [Trueperella pyogenes]